MPTSSRAGLLPVVLLVLLSGCASTVPGTAVPAGATGGGAAGGAAGGQPAPGGQVTGMRTVDQCKLVTEQTFASLGPKVALDQESAGMAGCELKLSIHDGKATPSAPDGVLRSVTAVRVETGVSYTDQQQFAARQGQTSQLQLGGGQTGYQATDDNFGCLVAVFPAGGAVQFSARSNSGGPEDCKVAKLAADTGASLLAGGSAPARSYPQNSLVHEDFCQLGEQAAKAVLGGGVQQRPGGLFACSWASGARAVTLSATDEPPGKLATIPGLRPIRVNGASGVAGSPFNFPGAFQLELRYQPSSVTPGQYEHLAVLLADTARSGDFGQSQAKQVITAVLNQLG